MNRPDAFVRRCKRYFVRWLAAVVALLASAGAVQAETVLRIVMNSDLKIIDPIWNTAFVIRDHGYMIYDTLFATDAEGEIRPQMVDRTEVSADKLTYTFTLRDGLKWHDGAPVTAEDCVASIRRWAARDTVGQKLMTFVLDVAARDARTIEIRLKEPTALLLPALGKPNSNVPFMMPRRIAETDPFTQITDSTGSGPFIFKRDEWRPGHMAVYVRNPDYKPRAERSRGWPAARSPRSTASNGTPCPTTCRRSMRCRPARSTSSRRRRSICTPCSRPTAMSSS